MRHLANIFAIAAGFLLLAPTVGAQDEGDSKDKPSAADKKKAKASVKRCDFSREFKALEEAAALLADVHNEKEAEKAARKICSMFNPLPPPMGGEEEQLEAWAGKANLLNYQMERLRREKWFVRSGLQEAWTLATDPFSRRRAEKKK